MKAVSPSQHRKLTTPLPCVTTQKSRDCKYWLCMCYWKTLSVKLRWWLTDWLTDRMNEWVNEWLIYWLMIDWISMTLGEIILTGEDRNARTSPSHRNIFPPKILQRVVWYWTQNFTVYGLQLTAWANARSLKRLPCCYYKHKFDFTSHSLTGHAMPLTDRPLGLMETFNP
jgi:hypothetical protein